MDALLAVLAVVASLLVPPTDEGSTGAHVDATPRVVRVLHDWDARRSAAWARGDQAALRSLYVAGSSTGRADRTALAAYGERGLRVPGLRFQVASVDLVARSPRRLVLAVTDRLVSAAAVGQGARWTLPADRWSTRVVAMRRVGGAWRVEEVCEPGQTPAAAITARTSRCAKS
jgi:hypothetical protein